MTQNGGQCQVIVSGIPSSSWAGLLRFFLCSRVRFLPWDRVLIKLLKTESFTQAEVLHELLHHRCLPWGAVFRNRLLQCGISHGVTSLNSKSASTSVSLSVGPQVLPGACFSTGLPWGQVSFRCIHLLQYDILQGLQVNIIPIVDLHEVQPA